jgi:D-glycero-alpha-D-manno-heptose 1-phosphate guanylyltransferase
MTAGSMELRSTLKAALLVGGLGTRLRSVVPSTPKPLAAVQGKPFLGLLVQQLCNQKITDLVMCTGYLGQQVRDEFQDGSAWGAAIQYSEESSPLGTAGAIKLAQTYLRETPEFVVLNGDSFVEIDFARLLQFHHEHGGMVSLAVLEVENAARYGTVSLTSTGRVTGFAEKTGSETPGIVNAGVYLFQSEIFDLIPDGPASLEKDVFPNILDRGVFALKQKGLFIDIGTPEDYARAQLLHDRLCESALA